jgi:hypothetical protein
VPSRGQDYSHHYSHWNAKSSLGDWLKAEGVPGISGIDTRLLTKKIRSRGAMAGRIELEDTGKVRGLRLGGSCDWSLCRGTSVGDLGEVGGWGGSVGLSS